MGCETRKGDKVVVPGLLRTAAADVTGLDGKFCADIRTAMLGNQKSLVFRNSPCKIRVAINR